MSASKYYIVVASKDHIAHGIAGGFIQANHGKATLLNKLRKDDWVIAYSPKVSYEGNMPLQAFTAIGQVRDEELYQYKMSDSFNPFRRNVVYYQCNERPIVPLIQDLDFIENKKAWGYRFRFGFFEIGSDDFELIRFEMITEKQTTIHQLQY
jgi:hypothetical protein